AERAGIRDLPVIAGRDAVEFAGLGIVDQVEQAREGVAQIEAAPAAMTDVEDAAHLRLGLGPVEEIRVFPRNDVAGRCVETAFAHGLSPTAGVLPTGCRGSGKARKRGSFRASRIRRRGGRATG